MVPPLRSILSVSSPIAFTAIASLVLLFCAVGYRVYVAFQPDNVSIQVADAIERADDTSVSESEFGALGPAANGTSTDSVSQIGPIIANQILASYEGIRAQGDYTKEDLHAAAQEIATYVKAGVGYETYENTHFRTDSDASPERVRTYRDDLQAVLAPLNSIGSAEYEMYARYMESGDNAQLLKLSAAAEMYRAVARSAADMEVPKDAVNYHRDLINALQGFGAVLRELSTHANDPIASVALLRTYNEKEDEIYRSFNGMRLYYSKKAL